MKEEPDYSDLVDGYCSGSLSDEEFALLEEKLRQDPELRRELLESRMLDSELRQFASTLDHLSPQQTDASGSAKISRTMWAGLGAVAAAILILAIGYSAIFQKQEDPTEISDSNKETTVEQVSLDVGVAVLARDQSARWVDTAPRPGESMAPGRWNLVSGIAEIQFYSGASVTLQAPAELEILSADGGILHRGKLRAEVPRHAHGFSIKTGTVELVDLGTSFGMSVGEDSETEIHVFDGEVELFGKDAQPGRGAKGSLLTAGQGRVFRKTGEDAPLQVDPSIFDGASQLDEKLREEFLEWQRLSAKWDRDPRLIARYDFERLEGAHRAVAAKSSLLDAETVEGVLIGAKWGQGRWPQKGALDFKRPSDQVRLSIPGERESLTVIASLRVDGTDNYYNSILLSDGWDRRGAFHWQILRNGNIELSISGGTDRAQDVSSRGRLVLEPSDLGRWMQLAVTYDLENGVVTHFQDGVQVGETRHESLVPIEIGLAEIGNWTPPPKQAREIRNFNGRIDEVIVFDAALGAEELATFYTGGQIRPLARRPADSIANIRAPARVTRGETVQVSVDYSLAEERKLEVNFTLDSAPWTNFGSANIKVPAGSGSLELEVPIAAATPEGSGAYKFEASIIPIGGAFEDRVDSLPRQGVTVSRADPE